jgi:hypothetical protein
MTTPKLLSLYVACNSSVPLDSHITLCRRHISGRDLTQSSRYRFSGAKGTNSMTGCPKLLFKASLSEYCVNDTVTVMVNIAVLGEIKRSLTNVHDDRTTVSLGIWRSGSAPGSGLAVDEPFSLFVPEPRAAPIMQFTIRVI